MLYFPEKELAATPQESGLAYQEIFFSANKDRKLHGWLVPHPKPAATLLFFHGNAGNISHRLEKIKILHDAGVTTFIIDYSGYGKSEGKPSEKNLYEDGVAAYEKLTGPVVLYGESLGSAVAIEIALQKKVAGIILEGAFTSLKALAKKHFPFLSGLAGDEYDNLEKIGRVSAPVLFIHATHDEICPFNGARELYEKTTAPKQSLWLESGGHNDAFWVNKELYFSTLCSFVSSRCLAR